MTDAPTHGAVLDAESVKREISRMREVANDWRRPALAQIEGPNDLKIFGGTIADNIDRWADLLSAYRLARPTPEYRAQINASDDNAAYASELLATPPAQPEPGAGELEVMVKADEPDDVMLEQLAMRLCRADGQDPHRMTYITVEPGVQEPLGDMWNHYLPQAREAYRAIVSEPLTQAQAKIARLEGEVAERDARVADLERNLRTVQNAAKTLHHSRDTELAHLRDNATFDHKLRAEHQSLLDRDAMMTDLLLAAEARALSAEADAAKVGEERDALLQAVGFKPGSMDRARDVILADAAAMRPAMVKARRAQRDAEGDAMLLQCFMAEGRFEPLLVKVWKRAKAAEARAERAEAGRQASATLTEEAQHG